MPHRDEGIVRGRWTMRKRDLGVAVWIAFLSASIGTVLVFAVVDPQEIQSAWMEQWDIGRKLAYSLGFAFLFLVCFFASWLSIFMIRSGPRRGHAHGQGARRVPDIHDPAEDNPDLDIEDLR